MSKKTIVTIIIVAVVMLGAYFIFSRPNISQSGKYDNFAKCLADKKITMYGTYLCTFCQNEKKTFGSSFKFVPYVECTEDPQKCLAAGVEAYPTWIFPDGQKLVGEQGLQKLSEVSGCPQ